MNLKQLGLLIVIFSVIASFIVSAACIDTDPADNPYVKGSISTGNSLSGVRGDLCINSETLFEQNCDGGDYVNCLAGCFDGACLESGSKLTGNSGCVDSDGKNFYTSGSVSEGTDFQGVQQDYCLDRNTLIEFTCSNSLKVTCPSGCLDGKCLEYKDTTPELKYEVVESAIIPKQNSVVENVKVEEVQEETVNETIEPKTNETTPSDSKKKILWFILGVILLGVVYFALRGKKTESETKKE